MQIVTKIKCPFCQSSMLAYAIDAPQGTWRLWFTCPNGCVYGVLSRVLDFLTMQEAEDTRIALTANTEYRNRCWQCNLPVNSALCVRDSIRVLGFCCNHCGHSLRGKLVQQGLIRLKLNSYPQGLLLDLDLYCEQHLPRIVPNPLPLFF